MAETSPLVMTGTISCLIQIQSEVEGVETEVLEYLPLYCENRWPLYPVVKRPLSLIVIPTEVNPPLALRMVALAETAIFCAKLFTSGEVKKNAGLAP